MNFEVGLDFVLFSCPWSVLANQFRGKCVSETKVALSNTHCWQEHPLNITAPYVLNLTPPKLSHYNLLQDIRRHISCTHYI